jgi:hypothetical protein
LQEFKDKLNIHITKTVQQIKKEREFEKEIISLYKEGLSNIEISEKVGLSKTFVYLVIKANT